jgi:hypothetical protein
VQISRHGEGFSRFATGRKQGDFAGSGPREAACSHPQHILPVHGRSRELSMMFEGPQKGGAKHPKSGRKMP